LNIANPTLSVNATSVAFGDVTVNTPATQSLTLSSTGAAAVTVNSAAVTGTGFSMSGASFPLTLNPGQSANLSVEFDPVAAGSVTGQLAIKSNSSTNPTDAIGLSGTGEAQSYVVDLSWSAPSGSTVSISGYNVYRAPSGSSSYLRINPSVDAQTSYVDNDGVQTGQTYDYVVKTVDTAGVESAPSAMAAVSVP
jgi:hypothetical protein